MSQLLSLGAIHKATGEYIYPKIANKKEEYIRVKLGQTIFPTPIEPIGNYIPCNICVAEGSERVICNNCNNCDNCKYYEWYHCVWKTSGHLRIDFDAREEYKHNKKIIELFSEDFGDKVILHSRKGMVTAFIVSTINNYYWNKYYGDFPYENEIEFGHATSTISIIKTLLEYCNIVGRKNELNLNDDVGKLKIYFIKNGVNYMITEGDKFMIKSKKNSEIYVCPTDKIYYYYSSGERIERKLTKKSTELIIQWYHSKHFYNL